MLLVFQPVLTQKYFTSVSTLVASSLLTMISIFAILILLIGILPVLSVGRWGARHVTVVFSAMGTIFLILSQYLFCIPKHSTDWC